MHVEVGSVVKEENYLFRKFFLQTLKKKPNSGGGLGRVSLNTLVKTSVALVGWRAGVTLKKPKPQPPGDWHDICILEGHLSI